MSIAKKYDFFLILEFIILLALIVGIIFINFSHMAHFYCTDMYTDMIYATEVWKDGSIFPRGWVFGNQFYVVATPVLSASFYGLTNDAIYSMSIASTMMALLVITSFFWMIAPVIEDRADRFFAVALFVMLPLITGDGAVKINGWQLLFTLCSYYACYAVTAFLAFGLYVRQFSDQPKKHYLMISIVLTLSFCTGIQSLRQTLIMVVPLLGFEFCNFLYRYFRKMPICRGSLMLTGLIALSNLLGVLTVRFIEVNQVAIFGDMQINWSIGSGIKEAVINIISLFDIEHKGLLLFAAVVIVSVFLKYLQPGNHANNRLEFVLSMLLLFSIIAVAVVDIITTMNVRNIYYFMMYPSLACWTIQFLSLPFFKTKTVKQFTALVISILFAYCAACNFYQTMNQASVDQQESYTEIANDLLDQHITTVYSQWNVAEKIAIVSDMNLKAAFWDASQEPFLEVRYLCNPDIFDKHDSKSSAYLFVGSKATEHAIQIVQDHGYQITLLKYYPECDIYVFTSEFDLINLIQY